MKKNMNLNVRAFIILLIIILLLGGIGGPTIPRAVADEKGIGLNEINAAIELLREEYIGEVDSVKLLNGAMEGIDKFLKLKKLDRKGVTAEINSDRSLEANMRSFGAAYGKILMYNGDKIKENDLAYAALKGIMEALQKGYDDPYSTAMDPKEFGLLQEQLNSKGFTGIGILIEVDKKNNDMLMVVEPIEGSPADKAGIKAGDYVLRINGVSTKGMNLDMASNRIRGPVGTPVTLFVERKSQKKSFEVKIMRDTVFVASLSKKMVGDLGYIKLRFFGESTGSEFESALKALEKQGAKGMIVDLRNNGGGYILAAVAVCSEFLKKDSVVTSVVNYRKNLKDTHLAYLPDNKRLPLVILVNRFSASASEITAGCVKDSGVGVLIGEKTFGKGSVQTIHPMPGGGAIKYTTAHYLTPSGKDINKVGIAPDIEVKMDPSGIGTAKDLQFQRAVGYLKAKVSKAE